MSYLKLLEGKQIQHLYVGEGFIYCLQTGRELIVPEIVIVMEDYHLCISNRIMLDPPQTKIEDLVGCFVQEGRDDDLEVTIITTDHRTLVIDLREDAWVGPEALVLNGPENLIVVWN